jgi:hypothetical protein
MRYKRPPRWVSHDRELERLYRELKALHAVREDRCIDPAWLRRRRELVETSIDEAILDRPRIKLAMIRHREASRAHE